MKDVIKEHLREFAGVTEAGKGEKKNEPTQEKKGTTGQYERVRSLLSNNIFNHAGVIEQLWGSKDATKRSLFRKKLNRMKNDEGGTYEFSEEEISKIISIMMDTSRQISTSLSKAQKSKD